ncbi:SNARE binding protein Sec1 [Schizosaccharomyces pombe]|uniref:Protein transport protein sec1 n=1 Tax=Schizosaccharomyces pombe (strain 972 / ATCC 24843) TaxID=284812 RepID=SEC1_SCHPO|nr:putative SNARE-binding protein Sec1 [Schizosaccharomyces pombe]O94590.1 RecName: Full=Protein transport protein sec1 [Schizosaccharomyces pombe 972h-]CAA21822.1 SNARE binding protein Sec1 (predicted) [Schizosaccharomyces pombe]|eukprot:NP_588226.1 putative SNARE-binding protein Sec1 [Schizosaccharomyces pombe]
MTLLELQKELFLSKINSVECATKWKVLIVDTKTADIINHFITIHSLLEEKIAAVEILENPRTPNSSFEALYILHSEEKLVDCILKDEEYDKRYPGIHIVFLDMVKEPLINKLRTSRIASKIRTVQVAYLDFTSLESRYFQVHDSFSGLRLYHPSNAAIIRQELSKVAHGIFSVCVSLGISPNIRCYYPKNAPHASKTMSFILANQLSEIVEEYCSKHPGYHEAASKSTCLIVDRSLDTAAPFLHEFTYQAMIHDLLPIKNEQYPYEILGPQGTEKRTGKLDDDDLVYTTIRHMHMRDAIEKLMKDFNQFCIDNTLFLDKERATSLNDMRSMLAGLSDFQELRDQYSLHLTMAQECMNIFEKQQLNLIGAIEQDLSTGSNVEGKVPRSVLSELLPLLDEGNAEESTKIRLLLLYIIYRDGIILQDLFRLFRHSNLSTSREQIFQNLEQLGTRVIKNLTDQSSKRKEVANSLPAGEDVYELSRYVPTLKVVLENLIQDKLDPELFPYVRNTTPQTEVSMEQTSLRSSRPSWTRSRSMASKLPREKMLVFVAGGTTFSELRTCYELSDKYNKDIYIGSTVCYSPNEWLDFFSKFQQPREALKFPEDKPRHIPCLEARPSPNRIQEQPNIDVPSTRYENTSSSDAVSIHKDEKKSKGKSHKLGKLMMSSKKDKDKSKEKVPTYGTSDKKKKKRFGVF